MLYDKDELVAISYLAAASIGEVVLLLRCDVCDETCQATHPALVVLVVAVADVYVATAAVFAGHRPSGRPRQKGSKKENGSCRRQLQGWHWGMAYES